MNLKRTGVLVALSAGGFLAASPAVQAVKWGTVTSSYDGKVRVEGHGTHFNDRGIRAANTMVIRDRSNDGNSVYGSTVFYYRLPSPTTGEMRWHSVGSRNTGQVANSSITKTVSVGLSAESEKSRAVSKACAQMGWPVPDSCGQAITSWDY